MELSPIEEASRESLSHKLEAVAEAVKSVGTLAQWREKVAGLPTEVRRTLLLFVNMPNVAAGLATDLKFPEDRTAALRAIASRAQELGTEEDRQRLRQELEEMARARRTARTYAEREDPLTHVIGRTVIDVEGRELKLRIMAGPAEDTLGIEFTKAPHELASLAAALIRWSREAIAELEKLGLARQEFVKGERLKEALAQVIDEASKLQSVVS